MPAIIHYLYHWATTASQSCRKTMFVKFVEAQCFPVLVQSSQSGPCWSRRSLRKLDSSYGPRGRSLGRRRQARVPASSPDHPVQSIALDMLYPGYAVALDALRTSALKCAGVS
ncbi:hypothetical protein TNCV_4398071 [Trichonephila clavipes]|nr:hypothetical protein TNCV_4398071 [Trichonephila clavipes]